MIINIGINIFRGKKGTWRRVQVRTTTGLRWFIYLYGGVCISSKKEKQMVKRGWIQTAKRTSSSSSSSSYSSSSSSTFPMMKCRDTGWRFQVMLHKTFVSSIAFFASEI